MRLSEPSAQQETAGEKIQKGGRETEGHRERKSKREQ